MAIVLTGTKTVTKDVSSVHTAAVMQTLFATALENITLAQFYGIGQALKRLPAGTSDKATTLGAIFL